MQRASLVALAAVVAESALPACSLLGFFEASPADCGRPPCGDGDSDSDTDADSDADSDADAGRDAGGDAGDGGADAEVQGPRCGDGVVDPEAGESCDPPNATDCSADCAYLGQACESPDECATGHCVDGVCCDSACDDQPCQRCDLFSSNGAGQCGHVSSATDDPDGDCIAGAAGEPGSCRTGWCSGASYSCGTLPDGEQGQPACKRCSGWSEDPADVANGSMDQEGNNTCEASCAICGGGSCISQPRGWDYFNRCEPFSCCGAGGSCDSIGSCNDGYENLSIGDCDDCNDGWCWARSRCGQRDCDWLDNDDGVKPGYYCQCFERDVC